MSSTLAVAISGSPRSPSKSKALAELLLQAFARGGCTTTLLDLSTLDGEALLARREDVEVANAIEVVGGAQIVIAATPTYRALYTGLLKCFFDLMPQGHLEGKLCLPVQTGADPRHALSPEYGLRPLFMSLDGVPLAGVYATDAEFIDGTISAELASKVEAAASAAVRLL